jgi:hypothetical protein
MNWHRDMGYRRTNLLCIEHVREGQLLEARRRRCSTLNEDWAVATFTTMLMPPCAVGYGSQSPVPLPSYRVLNFVCG